VCRVDDESTLYTFQPLQVCYIACVSFRDDRSNIHTDESKEKKKDLRVRDWEVYNMLEILVDSTGLGGRGSDVFERF
jgi:hypothetical protein